MLSVLVYYIVLDISMCVIVCVCVCVCNEHSCIHVHPLYCVHVSLLTHQCVGGGL